MIKLRYPLLAVLLLAGRCLAQSEDREPRRHISADQDVQPHIDNPDQALSDRLQSFHRDLDSSRVLDSLLHLTGMQKADLIRQLKENPGQRQKLLQELSKNPAWRQQLEESLKQRRLSEKDLDHIRAAAGISPHAGPQGAGATPDSAHADMARPDPPGTQSGNGGSIDANADPNSGLKGWMARTLPGALETLSKMGLKADADFVRSLATGKVPEDSNSLLGKFAKNATNVGHHIPFEKISDFFGGALDKVPTPDVSKLNLSNDDAPPADETTSVPSWRASSPGREAIVWAIILVIVAALVWKGKSLVRATKEPASRAWKLGPWPVRPDRVRTRAELIAAFEHLAFLVLGLAAQPRNHLALAADLAGTATTRRSAAERLARLYERARYAPAQETLPENELRTARQDLLLLAEVERA